jgi:protein-tyrosine phosphatase
MMKRQKSEQRNGVTPMDVTPVYSAEFTAAPNSVTGESNDWVFDGTIDLIQKTVEDFRQQRISMVQSLRQYVLCYETVMEWVGQQQQSTTRERSGSESRAVERRDS